MIAFIGAVALAILAVALPLFGARVPLQGGTRTEIDRLFEEKARVLRALKDLDHEREVGTLGEADWTTARAGYLDEAVRLNRAISDITGVQPPGAEAGR
jgi:hypothetical protein